MPALGLDNVPIPETVTASPPSTPANPIVRAASVVPLYTEALVVDVGVSSKVLTKLFASVVTLL